MFYVYLHKTNDGRVFYVGKGSKNRAWDQQRNKKWKWISKKYDYQVEVVEYFQDEKEALAYEVQLIEFFGTFTTDWTSLTLGCNFTIGGDDPPKGRQKGRKRTEEQRRRMSLAHHGKKLPKQSQEWIQNRVASRRANGTYKHSEESKKNISNKLLGNQNARKYAK